MRRIVTLLASSLFVLLQMAITPQQASGAPTAMIFCAGGMGDTNGLTTSQINGFRASGMTTMVIFTMGVDASGNFVYGGNLCSNGVYLGPSNWGTLLSQCKAAPSSVNRIEMCIGAWGDTSWQNIKNIIIANGINDSNYTNSVLFANLVALKNALGIDAIDNDDEYCYDSASTILFGKMCGAAGLKLTLCPYTRSSYWQAVKAGLGNIVDQVYLQCYDGGAGNNPATWNNYFGGLKVVPGYWDWERDTTFLNKMQAGKSAGCNGGFYWPSCTGCNPPADPGGMKQYADWILGTFNPTVTPATAAEVVGRQVTFTGSVGGSTPTFQWQVIRGGVTNNIPGATNSTLTLTNLQLTNTASYQFVGSNDTGVFVSRSSSLTVSSVPSPVNNVVTTFGAQTGLGKGFPFTPTWTVPSGSVISGLIPSSTNGSFSLEMTNRSVNTLTDNGVGTIALINGTSGSTCSTNYLTCGGSAGTVIIYTLTNSSASGYNLTNITVYGGWADGGRDQQAYTVYYSKISAPASFLYLGTVNYNPANSANAPSATRATLAPATGFLATNVAAVKFDFTSPASENGYCGYSKITMYGVPLNPVVATNTLPATATDVVGGQVTFMAGFNSAYPLNYQWQIISGGVTNDINGAINPTLTLTNLQLADSASYQLKAYNAYGTVVSAPGSLTVNSLPAALNNIVTSYAAQTGFGSAVTNFVPTWTVTPGSLIGGQLPSSVGGGSFSLYYAGVVSVLTDGAFGWINYWPNIGSSPTEVTCGTINGGAGQSVTYTLTGSTNGYTLTNIVVFGGWGDAGRDQQAYTIYYSTIAAPSTFVSLASANYNPVNPSSVQSATRATFTPVNGILASNVVAIKFNFTTPTPENGYCGYSEIDVYGLPTAPPVATNPTNITAQLSENSLTLSWPGDHIGWRLQVQTNDLTQGFGTNWVDILESTTTNELVLPMTPGNGSVFYRLVYP